MFPTNFNVLTSRDRAIPSVQILQIMLLLGLTTRAITRKGCPVDLLGNQARDFSNDCLFDQAIVS